MRLGESIGMKSIVYSIIFVTVVLYYIYYNLVDYMPIGEPQPSLSAQTPNLDGVVAPCYHRLFFQTFGETV